MSVSQVDKTSIYQAGFALAEANGDLSEAPYFDVQWKRDEFEAGYEYFSIWQKEHVDDCGK